MDKSKGFVRSTRNCAPWAGWCLGRTQNRSFLTSFPLYTITFGDNQIKTNNDNQKTEFFMSYT